MLQMRHCYTGTKAAWRQLSTVQCPVSNNTDHALSLSSSLFTDRASHSRGPRSAHTEAA